MFASLFTLRSQTQQFSPPLFRWGRNRIDTRSKDESCVRHGTAVNGLQFTNANDNFAFGVAANDNIDAVEAIAA